MNISFLLGIKMILTCPFHDLHGSTQDEEKKGAKSQWTKEKNMEIGDCA